MSTIDSEARKYKSLLNTSTILNANLDLYQLLPLIMLYSKDLLEAEASSLFLLEEKDGFLYCEVALGEKGEIIQKYARLEPGQGIAGWVAKEKKAIILEDAYTDPRFNPALDQKTGFRTRSLACVPLYIADKVIGTLEILNKSQNRSFESSDLEVLNSLSEMAAIAIKNAQAHETLKKRVLELRLLYEFEKLTVAEKSISELGNWLLDKVLEFLEAKAGTIYLADPTLEVLRVLAARGIPEEAIHNIQVPYGEGISGWVAKEKQSLLIQNLEEDPRYDKSAKYKFEANSLISAPLLFRGELLGVISVNNKYSGFAFTHADLEMLGAIANRLSVTIKNANLFHKVLDTDRELKRAREVMHKILPSSLPYVGGLEFGVQHIPYDNVGGDFYNILKLDENRSAVLIADVSGHGLSASVVATVIHTVVSTFDAETLGSPSKFFTALNYALYNKLAGNFLTAFYAIIHTGTNTMSYTNAGHNPPILYRRSEGSSLHLETKGKLVGVIPDLFFEEYVTAFQPQDRLVLYTDGLTEHSNSDRTRRYSEDLLTLAVRNHSQSHSAEAAESLIKECRTYCHRSDFEDDVTLLIVDRV
ncbi:serine/threonine protein phosphatase [Leptospira hartskeerlii]|uniref:Serine/threonine protein phosphatase n=1 Tax=Leptospira hartskeerlii TaxID=2023177 RepID=A0A2M9XG76_9LEPT|nr:GAF domain-containing SpoIIE family protein phosphatase [Leptospira hartskeerlii]PJZ26644.1 serine/threonine protein phosphatase [Leptospira hartskeerlii]PJZ34874.1 serine/threonine protein phosphatase [Leptospira hartskeerlii]